MDISSNIKAIRERKRLTQNEVAERIGVDGSNYAKQEKRGSKLDIEQLKRIADALEVGIIELITGTQSNDESEKVQLQTKIEELKEKYKVLETDYNRLKDMFDIMLPLAKDAVEFVQLFKSLTNNAEDSEGSIELTERQQIAIKEVQKLLKERQGDKGKFLGLF